jgi:hypothetical protein
MTSILVVSTSIPLSDMRCQRIIPSWTMKWHFSQFSTRSFSWHLCKTLSKFSRHWSKVFPQMKSRPWRLRQFLQSYLRKWTSCTSWKKLVHHIVQTTYIMRRYHKGKWKWSCFDLVKTGIPIKETEEMSFASHPNISSMKEAKSDLSYLPS